MAVYNKSGTSLKCIKSIAHRGYSATAPENTIPAYALALENGFKYVECDISLTSDGVPMLLHDATIDRTSNGSGTLSQMTYNEVRQYDFGSWKSSAYSGTVIPTLEEFLEYCAENSLHPYLELKQNGNYTSTQVEEIVEMVEDCGLKDKSTYISFSLTYLGYVSSCDPSARLGYLVSSMDSSAISSANGLLTGQNEVFLDSSSYGSSAIALCAANNIPLEIWTLESIASASSLDDYISGATGNSGQPSLLDSYQECFACNGTTLMSVYNASGRLI